MIPLTSQCNKSSKHQNQDERGILVYTLGLYINISHPQSQFLVIVTCLRAYKEVWIGCTQTHPPHPHSPKLNAHDVSEPSGLFWHFLFRGTVEEFYTFPTLQSNFTIGGSSNFSQLIRLLFCQFTVFPVITSYSASYASTVWLCIILMQSVLSCHGM